MIKALIYDIAFGNIELSQALGRAKLVASKVKSDLFKSWLKNELEGYSALDESLPTYRKLYSPVSLTIDYPNGQSFNVKVKAGLNADPLLVEMITFQHVTRPISIVQEEMKSMSLEGGVIIIADDVTNVIKTPYSKEAKLQGGVIRHGFRRVSKSDYHRIIELTKQKLLDTLLELDSQFPDLIDDYKMTTEEKEKVSNIVNNHIYGSHNPITNALGAKVEIGDITNTFTTEQHQELTKFGVSNDEIQELKELIRSTQENTSQRKSGVGKWLGGVLASAASKGIVENIPQITEFVTRLM